MKKVVEPRTAESACAGLCEHKIIAILSENSRTLPRLHQTWHLLNMPLYSMVADEIRANVKRRSVYPS